MNSPQIGLRVAGLIFGLASLAHLLRLFLGFQVTLGRHPVPVWTSGAGFVAAGVLSFWLWRLSVPAGTPPPPPKT